MKAEEMTPTQLRELADKLEAEKKESAWENPIDTAIINKNYYQLDYALMKNYLNSECDDLFTLKEIKEIINEFYFCPIEKGDKVEKIEGHGWFSDGHEAIDGWTDEEIAPYIRKEK